MDVRGGGAAAEDRRIVKDGYESDDEEAKPGERTAGQMPFAAPSAVSPTQYTVGNVVRSLCGVGGSSSPGETPLVSACSCFVVGGPMIATVGE